MPVVVDRPDGLAVSGVERKDAILAAACDNFGRFGFRGASLREIARDAGVSTPLLDHHFGGKARLLAAVMDSRRAWLDARVGALRRLVDAGTGAFTSSDLLQSWLGLAFELAATPSGQMFLRLLAHVVDEPAEEGLHIARDPLDEAERLFVEALQQCYPEASRDAAAGAYVCVNGALLRFLTHADRKFRIVQSHEPLAAIAEDRSRLTGFLLGGIEAMLCLEVADPPRIDATEGESAGRAVNRARYAQSFVHRY